MSASIVRAMGRGIAFSEGQEWKRKRKIISAAFNFDFVKSITHKIEKLCDKAIRDVEETALHI
jgi:cytochrome P450